MAELSEERLRELEELSAPDPNPTFWLGSTNVPDAELRELLRVYREAREMRVESERIRALLANDADLIVQLVDEARAQNQVCAAYVIDRAHRYENGSGYFAAFEELAQDFSANEHLKAHSHGELEDILKKLRPPQEPKL